MTTPGCCQDSSTPTTTTIGSSRWGCWTRPRALAAQGVWLEAPCAGGGGRVQLPEHAGVGHPTGPLRGDLTMDMAWPANHRPVIQAYLDLGLDLIYAPTLRSQNGYVYGPDEDFLATLPAELRQRVVGNGLGLTGSISPRTLTSRPGPSSNADFGDRIQMVIGPDGPEWCSETELRLAAQRATAEGACLHLHNSESPLERQWALQTQGQTMTGYLAEIGFLGPNVSCGHGVWYSDGDVELLAEHGVVTVHNPSSNLRLGTGIAPVAAYLEAGMTVALGTDGQGLTERSNFLEEMRLAAYLQRFPSRRLPAA